MNAAWRIRNARDAIEAGMLQSADAFIAARNRLAIRLGGQASAQTALEGLLESSLLSRNQSDGFAHVRFERVYHGMATHLQITDLLRT